MRSYTVYANYPDDPGCGDEFIIGKTVEAATPADAALERLVNHTLPNDQKKVRRVLVVPEDGVFGNPRVFDVARIDTPTFAVTPLT